MIVKLLCVWSYRYILMIGCCQVQPQLAFIFYVFWSYILIWSGVVEYSPSSPLYFMCLIISLWSGVVEIQPQLAFYISCVWSLRYFPYDRVLSSTTPARLLYFMCVVESQMEWLWLFRFVWSDVVFLIPRCMLGIIGDFESKMGSKILSSLLQVIIIWVLQKLTNGSTK